VEREELERAKEKILKFIRHPAVRSYFENLGLDTDKLEEDIRWVLENYPEIKVWGISISKKREKTLSISDIAYYLPEQRSSFKYKGEPITTIAELNNYLYYDSNKFKSRFFLLLSLALARHFLEKFGELPKYFFGSVALLRAAHEGEEDIFREAFETKKRIGENIRPLAVPLYLKDLIKLSDHPDPKGYLQKLKELEELYTKKGPQRI